MNTPIADFIRNYAARNPVRLHMPGHKGRELLGCEALDITEIPGADELYVAGKASKMPPGCSAPALRCTPRRAPVSASGLWCTWRR